MKYSIILFFLFINSILSKNSIIEIDTEKSRIFWAAKNLTTRETGYFKLKSGSITMKNDIHFRNGEFIIDMESLTCTSLLLRERLEKHLKSKDFLWTKRYPTARIKIHSAKEKNEFYRVKSNLTLKGKTNRIKFKAQISFTNGYPTKASGMFTIDRTFWNITFSGIRNNIISDEVEIEFSIYTK